MSMPSQNSIRVSHSSVDGLGFAESNLGVDESVRFIELGKNVLLFIQGLFLYISDVVS